MRIVITGGAGFLGSHLCEQLLERGDSVVCADNFSTGLQSNIKPLLADPLFSLLDCDVSESLAVAGSVDAVAHLASPASPPDYHRLPLETLAVGSRGTENALKLAAATGARFIVASTSEIYGDPLVHPQTETYWGNVNPIGPRSVYDESKRFAEAISAAYGRTLGVDVGIVRIFNTYGPRMRANDGRVVSTFVSQALNGDPITIYGDGSQTRSFCFVDDLVRGLIAMLDSHETGPINLGNPFERTMLELAKQVIGLLGSPSVIEHHPLPADDPTRRRPDISRAVELLGWEPSVNLEDGLKQTIDWFTHRPNEVAGAAEALSGPQFEGRVAA